MTDPRQLREDAGISRATVAAAFGVSPQAVSGWELDPKRRPRSPAWARWRRFTEGLERHAAVTAEIAATEKQAA